MKFQFSSFNLAKRSHKLILNNSYANNFQYVLFLILILNFNYCFSLSLSPILPDTNISKSINSPNPGFWNVHYQFTFIPQYHPPFKAKYSGQNSLDTNQELDASYTTTLFLGHKLWDNAELYVNPEMSAGSGFSQTAGMAGFPNAEIYRVSDPNPKIYLARLFIKQIFNLNNDFTDIDDDVNQIKTKRATSYISLSFGRFSMDDYFDINSYSHDPRSQFLNWALMSNGAWDYPANTRGYTWGIVAEFIKPGWAVRFSSAMVPTYANGSIMDPDFIHANGETLELERKYSIFKRKGTIRFLSYLNSAHMGNYEESLKLSPVDPDITQTRAVGRTKYGFGLNIEQEINDNIGFFLRSGWDDGHTETWIFTEIDRTLSGGFSFKGNLWHRPEDYFGIAQIINGLSPEHEAYLKAGGYGFIIGDGNLNYGYEMITELYYSYSLTRIDFNAGHTASVIITPDYQFAKNPAFNKDRGPVNIFSLRIHFEF